MLARHAAPLPRANASDGRPLQLGLPSPEQELWSTPSGFQSRSSDMSSYDDSDAWSLDLAVGVLDAVTRSCHATDDPFHRRAHVLNQHIQSIAAESSRNDQQQRAYVEHLHTTIHVLHAELESQRRYGSMGTTLVESPLLPSELTASVVTMPPVMSSPATPTRKPIVSTALTRSPLAARVSPPGSRQLFSGSGSSRRENEWTSVLSRGIEQRVVKKNAGVLPELETSQKELQAAAKLISTRERKLKEILKEKAYWQQEYQLMREQVVAEKMRQVELFHRLETHKREHLQRCDAVERALREAQHENELLKSQLAEARVKLMHQRDTLSAVLRQSKEEKEGLVCTIAETRHKFKEWKDGEAMTLKAARDQAVHTLKTEYELKIARHHLEKQKLRDKVKDLEVSLRLLQKDRHLSPHELSLRKATILGTTSFATTSEAELIEAHCRIKELEALLDHAKEYQKRQENIIKMSEGTITKLEQEREVVALEHATMLQPLSVSSPFDPRLPPAISPQASPNAIARLSQRGFQSLESKAAHSRTSGGSASMLSLAVSPSATNFKLGQADAEKEHLRRQSMVLTAEVEKYRHMVVTSLDEIRSLRDNRRRSLIGASGANNAANGSNLLTAREQYLMNELAKLQKELDSIKEGGRQSKRLVHEQLREGQADTSSGSDTSDDSSSDSDSDSDSDHKKESKRRKPSKRTPGKPIESPEDQDAAVKVIQSRSKGFLLRRDFIKKKRAIDKIKAQYRGYLVRKNMELLDRTRRPFVVTDAMQVKMQLIDVHHVREIRCLDKWLRLELRVSKDPPIVQSVLNEVISLEASLERPVIEPPSRIGYFHLFEIVALLPLRDETQVLETSSPSDIAQLIGSLLEISLAAGEYKFRINRQMKHRQESRLPPLLPAVTGSYLTPLQVQSVASPLQADEEPTVQNTAIGSTRPEAREDDDLDALIRLSRCPSTELKVVILSSITTASTELIVAEDSPSGSLSRLSRRQSSSLEPIPEKSTATT